MGCRGWRCVTPKSVRFGKPGCSFPYPYLSTTDHHGLTILFFNFTFDGSILICCQIMSPRKYCKPLDVLMLTFSCLILGFQLQDSAQFCNFSKSAINRGALCLQRQCPVWRGNSAGYRPRPTPTGGGAVVPGTSAATFQPFWCRNFTINQTSIQRCHQLVRV